MKTNKEDIQNEISKIVEEFLQENDYDGCIEALKEFMSDLRLHYRLLSDENVFEDELLKVCHISIAWLCNGVLELIGYPFEIL